MCRRLRGSDLDCNSLTSLAMVSGVPWIFLERERKSFEMARLWMRRGQDDSLRQKPAYSAGSPQGGGYSFSLLRRSCFLEHHYAWQGIEASSAAS